MHCACSSARRRPSSRIIVRIRSSTPVDCLAHPLFRSIARLHPAWRRRMCLAVGLAAVIGWPTAHAMDVNRASAAELQTLRGIGPKTARSIVQERGRGGRFESMTDFAERIRGIGDRKRRALETAGLSAGASTASSNSHSARKVKIDRIPPGHSDTPTRATPELIDAQAVASAQEEASVSHIRVRRPRS